MIEEQVERIRAQVGSERIICGLSGGVDSAVAALLVYKAVGDQLTCVFVDHGLLRENEADQVVETFGHHFHVPLVHVDARERFLSRLDGVVEPEEKRTIVGEEFIRVFEEEARKLGDVRFLVQGTLYSDVIESGGDIGVAAKIKSHHNVGGLPADMRMELVEPLRALFKDEVRRVGEQLGLPERMVWRHPFPGPGLAIRIIGDVTEERLAILRAADAVLLEEVRRARLYRELWQCFAVLPAIRSVGVQGDERTYAYPIVIRAVTSEDAMTADWARLPYELLDTIASRIVNEVPGVNRVALDLLPSRPRRSSGSDRGSRLRGLSLGRLGQRPGDRCLEHRRGPSGSIVTVPLEEGCREAREATKPHRRDLPSVEAADITPARPLSSATPRPVACQTGTSITPAGSTSTPTRAPTGGRSTPTATASSSVPSSRRTRSLTTAPSRSEAVTTAESPGTIRTASGRVTVARSPSRATFRIPRKRATQSSAGRAQSSSGAATWARRPWRRIATRSPSANASPTS